MLYKNPAMQCLGSSVVYWCIARFVLNNDDCSISRSFHESFRGLHLELSDLRSDKVRVRILLVLVRKAASCLQNLA